MLNHNLASNGLLRDVKPLNRALASDSSNLTIGYNSYNPGGSKIKDYKKQIAVTEESNDFVVPTIMFKDIVPSGKFMLKLDCEGCEYFVINQILAHEAQVEEFRGEQHPVTASAWLP